MSVMTGDEWVEKAENEGFDYAVTGYGLSESDLDDGVSPVVYNAIRDYRIAAQDANALKARIYKAIYG